jgi:predicted 3-demethylubiquinone-9 3-methyltransferase (glyoxalase superfamily)
MNKITPFLWFDGQAEEAAKFYVAVFRNGRILKTVRFGDAGPGPKGAVMTVSFEVNGQQFTGLNGGPQFKFTEAISFVVSCETQAEIDSLWTQLSADGGNEGRCGWVQDKYGLWWQLVPPQLPDMLADQDPARANQTMQAMMQMGKLDIATLQKAHRGAA